MRKLRFIVEALTIRLDPDCCFEGLVPGTEGYLQAEFSFSPEWDGCKKVAAFYSVMGTEYPPQILENGKNCTIPAEALKNNTFRVQVMGKKDDLKLVTNKVSVHQNGGNI